MIVLTLTIRVFALMLLSFILPLAPSQASDGPTYSLEQSLHELAQARLGQQLFNYSFEASNGTKTHCRDCHQAKHSFSDPQPFSVMASGIPSTFNTSALVRLDRQVVYGIAQLEPSLAMQIRHCFEDKMAIPPAKLLFSLQSNIELKAKFNQLFGKISAGGAYQVLAQYLTSMMVTPSKYDQFVAGNVSALSEAETEGYQLFIEHGCNHCHSGSELGGLTSAPVQVDNTNVWRKVPVLRNIIYTSPYLHDGSQASLMDTVKQMAHMYGYRALNDAEAEKIVQFLAAHTSSMSDVSGEVFHAPR